MSLRSLTTLLALLALIAACVFGTVFFNSKSDIAAAEAAKAQSVAVEAEALAAKAKAEADKLIQNAEYLKQKRINEAVEQVAMFTAMYEEYALNPDITRSRMYYEAIQEILPGVKLYINGSETGEDVQMVLPLDEFISGN